MCWIPRGLLQGGTHPSYLCLVRPMMLHGEAYLDSANMYASNILVLCHQRLIHSVNECLLRLRGQRIKPRTLQLQDCAHRLRKYSPGSI